jgi:hypothetical protein
MAAATKLLQPGELDRFSVRAKSESPPYNGAVLSLAIFIGMALFNAPHTSYRDTELVLTGLAMGMPVLGFRAPSCSLKSDAATLSDAESSISEALSRGPHSRVFTR